MASRTPAQIEAQKAAALARAQAELSGASQTASIESTPPGYISGFKMVLTPEYKIDIYPGVANVGGVRVELGQKYTLKPEDEMMIRLSKMWWYLYIDKSGRFYADVVPPEFKPQWMAYYHKNHPWRNIGKYYVCDDHLCRFASNWQQSSEQTVYVAPAGFEGIANYYCTGTDDQILINAAIRYLHEAYDGGEVSFLQGTYKIHSSITIESGITINGSGPSTVLRNNASVSQLSTGIIQNTASGGLDNVTIRNIGFDGNITDALTWFTYGVYIANSGTVTNVVINNCRFDDMFEAIKCTSNKCQALDNYITSPTNSGYGRRGIYITGNYAEISRNTISIVNCYLSIHGITCDGNDSKIVDNQVNYLTCSTLGATTVYGIISSGNNCIIKGNRVDNITSPNNTNLGVSISGNYNKVDSNNVSNTASGAHGAITHKGIYVTGISNSLTGNVAVTNGADTGIANTNGDNFYDAGTDTQVYSNSWQQPVAGQPSLGTKHYLSATLVNGTATTSTNPYTVTVSGDPAGTNSIAGFFSFVSTAVNDYLQITNTTGSVAAQARIQNAGVYNDQPFSVILTTGKQFAYFVSSTRVSAVYIYQKEYWV